jgi:quinol monooxygenase YgiN
LVVFCADDADADTFCLFEMYRDRASQQENGQAPWFFEYLQKVQPLLAGMPEVVMGTPQWAKGTSV